ncbi:MAG: NADH-quinone oxidoreductase subunit A [Planctomycetia bacterium]|nr:NADH-quinone oxidoreductase subunit A [Planctomycetia bacterium]
MQTIGLTIPIFLFLIIATAQATAMLLMGRIFGPSRNTAVKEMPYESGMDPIHDTRRRFDIRFHLVAIAFLVFDVEVLFMYPWAVAARRAAEGQPARGIDAAVAQGMVADRGIVFGVMMFFIALFAVGFVYALRKGVFRWR